MAEPRTEEVQGSSYDEGAVVTDFLENHLTEEGEVLWADFQDHFENWSLESFRRIPKRLCVKLRQALRTHSVRVETNSRRAPLPDSLYNLLQEEEPTQWSDEDLAKIRDEYHAFLSTQIQKSIQKSIRSQEEAREREAEARERERLIEEDRLDRLAQRNLKIAQAGAEYRRSRANTPTISAARISSPVHTPQTREVPPPQTREVPAIPGPPPKSAPLPPSLPENNRTIMPTSYHFKHNPPVQERPYVLDDEVPRPRSGQNRAEHRTRPEHQQYAGLPPPLDDDLETDQPPSSLINLRPATPEPQQEPQEPQESLPIPEIRSRGRPRKYPIQPVQMPKRGRGRPRKHPSLNIDSLID